MKRIIAGILWILSGGCILNDVPNPVIYGNVTKIEFSGQQKCAINTKTRTIELTLSDTVDIQHVRLNVLELEATPARKQEVLIEAEASIAAGTFLNLSQPCRFTVSTYQDYEWTITTDQPIERWVKVENQSGEEVINVEECMVSVYLKKGQDFSNVCITDLQLGPSIATYQPNWTDLKDFKRKQTILLTCFGRTERWEIAMFEERNVDPEPSDMSVDVNEWAHFAYASTKLPAGTEGTPAFEYRSGGGDWQRVQATKESGSIFQAKLEGLKANTRYTVRAVVGEQSGTESTFTTERDDQIPYSNFDTWYLDGKAWCTGVEGIVTWDSGNKGSANYGNTNPTTEEKIDVVKNSAARLESHYAVIKFAAGSLYTGKFGGIDAATLNAKLDFGIPYTCRPTSLSGWYKYNPATIVDRVPKDGKYDFLKNTMDSCHIYVALCDWTDAFHANSTPPGTFVDYTENNLSIIAYGELKDNRAMDEYEKFTIDIQYRDTITKPKYIVIVATSSKYGDYFAGAVGSVLLLDEFELGFD